MIVPLGSGIMPNMGNIGNKGNKGNMSVGLRGSRVLVPTHTHPTQIHTSGASSASATASAIASAIGSLPPSTHTHTDQFDRILL